MHLEQVSDEDTLGRGGDFLGHPYCQIHTWNRYLMKIREEEVVSSSVTRTQFRTLQGKASVASR
eukprot:1037683-Pelagomonas_calceolata.AAC.12